MKKYFEIAKIKYAVSGDTDKIPVGEILEGFVSASSEEDVSIELRAKEELTAPEGDKVYGDMLRVVYKSDDSYVRYEGVKGSEYEKANLRIRRCKNKVNAEIKTDSLTEKILLSALELEHNITLNRGILLHCAFIDVNGEAVLFTAPSGTGKSTQAMLWEKFGNAELINGDRAAVMVTADGVFASGVPFCGSSGVRKNRTLKLRAVVYLSQSKENRAQRLLGLTAFKRIWEGITLNLWHKTDVEKATDTVLEIVEKVPVYHFHCTKDETAVKVLEKILQE